METKAIYELARKVTSRIPKDDREDVIQDIALALWQENPDDLPLARAIAHNVMGHYWERRSYRVHQSLDESLVDDVGAETPLWECLEDRNAYQPERVAILKETIAELLALGVKTLRGNPRGWKAEKIQAILA